MRTELHKLVFAVGFRYGLHTASKGDRLFSSRSDWFEGKFIAARGITRDMAQYLSRPMRLVLGQSIRDGLLAVRKRSTQNVPKAGVA